MTMPTTTSRWSNGLLWAACFAAVLTVWSSAAWSADWSHKRVLLLYSYHLTFPTTDPVMRGVRSVLDKYKLTIDFEFMDAKRHSDAQHLENFSSLLRHKLATRAPYDVVLAADDIAFEFATAHRATLFRNAPLIFLGVNNKAKALQAANDPGVTGVVEAITVDETLRLARRLRPGLKRVYLVVDDTESGRSDLDSVRQVADDFPDLAFLELHLGALTWEELVYRLRGLQQDSIVMRLSSFRDRMGIVLSLEDVFELFERNTSVPVFALREHDVIAGALGGHVVSFEEQGRQAALMVERMLAGAPVESFKVLSESPNRYMFNFPALKRFDISERRLPADAVILFKPASIVDQYAREVWLAVGFVSMLLLLIIYLVFQIKARHRAEAEVCRHRDNLETMVAERTASLTAAKQEIESFSYSVSHDLRAPLRGIDGFSQLLLSEYSDKLDDIGRDYLRRIRRGAQHMAQLIDDILMLSRITRLEMCRQSVDLSGLCSKIVEELRHHSPERGDVEVIIAPGLTANCDPRLMEVALSNLLGNAWKYTGKRQAARIEFGSMAGDKGRVYFVRDNGVGFDMKYVDKLFQPFQRLHTLAEFPGTGIGLATAARVITRHGGRIWAESDPDKGSTFFFTLAS